MQGFGYFVAVLLRAFKLMRSTLVNHERLFLRVIKKLAQGLDDSGW